MPEGRVLVTGAGGFIGRHLVGALERAGWAVVPMSRNPGPGGAAWPEDGAFRPELLDGIEAVCHAAAFKDPSRPAECYRVNVVHTHALLESAVAARVRHFVYLSAGNAYAAGETPRVERDPLYPDGAAMHYLMSKVAGEVCVSAAQRRGVIGATILRPSSVYGPGMTGGMMPTFVERARRGEEIEVQNGGIYAVDLVSVFDVAAAAVSALQRGVFGTFNIASGRRLTSADAARAVVRVIGSGTVRVVGDPKAGGFPPLDIAKAQRELGFAPLTLEEAVRRWVEEAA